MSETAKRLRCIGAMSAAVESNRQLVLHFKRPVEDEDRAAVLAAINAAIARPAGDEGCGEALADALRNMIAVATDEGNFCTRGMIAAREVAGAALDRYLAHRSAERAALSARGEQAAKDQCANCGHPRKEHSYNGACYGLCGEFVAPKPPAVSADVQASRKET